MPEFFEFGQLLGAEEGSPAFANLLALIGSPASVSEDPDDHDDPVGKTRYYSFRANGILMGVRGGVLKYVFFYFENEEGYRPYSGPLCAGVAAGWSRAAIDTALGAPQKSGGGKPDPLMGYIHHWATYGVNGYKVRFEFGKAGHLRMVSLMPMA
ncbi:hypothetical protein [Duganella sp. S19_KUP01_CR8]|uniref:hypothetical protein n=1 Tax=Duganella sp. S19_KUP01_CR8 TaxID=3025502 RepID=UPI002FCD8D0E